MKHHWQEEPERRSTQAPAEDGVTSALVGFTSRIAICSLVAGGLVACATAPLTETGILASYTDLQPSHGMLTKTRLKVNKAVVMAANSASIIPTEISAQVRPEGLTKEQLRLVANAIDRALCANLSQRLSIVALGQPADLTVHAVITHLAPTDVTVAGVSKAANVGGMVATAATGVPIPMPRIPLGMGGLSVEAWAETPQRQSVAAMTWARGADAITTKARVSGEADAYALAKQFAGDFGKLVVTGVDPIRHSLPALPSVQNVREFFGGSPQYVACEQFGRNPGVGDALGEIVGLPPQWTDGGAK